MRTIFFGATELGLACCEAAVAEGHDIVGIVSMPREFSISYSPQGVVNVTHADFAGFAATRGIPFHSVSSGRADELLSVVDAWQPDFGLAIGWFYLVPQEIRRRFALGVAGVHASLLPKYRGGAPLVWAMINGEHTTGVTLFYLDDGVDTGDIIDQEAFPIADDDVIADVLAKATTAAVDVVRRSLPDIAAGKAHRLSQDERKATTFPQRRPQDGLIDWSKSGREISQFIRAQTKPYPGAFTILEGKRVTIWSADIGDA